jgi:hypothetical protein
MLSEVFAIAATSTLTSPASPHATSAPPHRCVAGLAALSGSDARARGAGGGSSMKDADEGEAEEDEAEEDAEAEVMLWKKTRLLPSLLSKRTKRTLKSSPFVLIRSSP